MKTDLKRKEIGSVEGNFDVNRNLRAHLPDNALEVIARDLIRLASIKKPRKTTYRYIILTAYSKDEREYAMRDSGETMTGRKIVMTNYSISKDKVIQCTKEVHTGLYF